MAITNEPIALDSTAQGIVEELDKELALLDMTAILEDTRNDISAIAEYIRTHSVEENRKKFPEGTQIVVPWKNMDDPAHNGYFTAYRVPMDVVHHDVDAKGSPRMYLQWHYAVPIPPMPYAYRQAAMLCPDGLVSGDYAIGLLEQMWLDFHLSEDVPEGGMLELSYEQLEDGGELFSVTPYGGADNRIPTEDPIPCDVVIPPDSPNGTILGRISYTDSDDGQFNDYYGVMNRSVRWEDSVIRRYLNSDTEDWKKPGSLTFGIDVSFDYEDSKAGFLAGFGSDFLSVIKPVKHRSYFCGSYVYGSMEDEVGYVECEDYIFIPSTEELYFLNPNADAEDDDDKSWTYWKLVCGSPDKTDGTSNNRNYRFYTLYDWPIGLEGIYTRSVYEEGKLSVVTTDGRLVTDILPNDENRFCITPVCAIG